MNIPFDKIISLIPKDFGSIKEDVEIIYDTIREDVELSQRIKRVISFLYTYYKADINRALDRNPVLKTVLWSTIEQVSLEQNK